MNRYTALFLGTALFSSHFFVVAIDKPPDDFPDGVSIQNYTDGRMPPTRVGTVSIYSGLLGSHPLIVNDFSQDDELKPTFISSPVSR